MIKRDNFKNGFTLIELLIVVLIIGVLAAVALPQYKKAVEKSKATQAFSMLGALRRAQQAYYLANGKYATKFEELAVDIPWTGDVKWFPAAYVTDTRSNEDWSVQIYEAMGCQFLLIGRLRGKYRGSGFALPLVLDNLYRGNKRGVGVLECQEPGALSSAAIKYTGTPGSYCRAFWKGVQEPMFSSIYVLP